jgi:Lon protease-like protein
MEFDCGRQSRKKVRITHLYLMIYEWRYLGSLRSGVHVGRAFRCKIAVQRVNGGFQNEVTVGTSVNVTLDLLPDGRRQPTF